MSTRILALDGKGGALPFADYPQWELAQRAAAEKAAVEAMGRPTVRAAGSPAAAPGEKPKRLGYLEQREWEQMEGLILEAERQLEACAKAAHDPAVVSDHEVLPERLSALAAAQAEVDRLYARWADLEAKVKG